MRRSISITFTLLLFVPFILCSCASPQFTKIEVKIPNDFKMNDTEIMEKIPLVAGLFLKSYIKNFIYKGSAEPIPLMQRVSFFMGAPLCAGSERILKNIFKDVVVIYQSEINLFGQNIDVIVTPELSESNLSRQNIDVIVTPELIEIKRFRYNTKMRLIMKWNIASIDGKNIYFNTITGEVEPQPIYKFTASGIEEKQRENMIALINDHFLKAQTDLYSNGWWKKQWWKINANMK